MGKLGRPPILPKPDGTLHAAAKWENRLWIHSESMKYGLSYGAIVDELVEAQRKGRGYDPSTLAATLNAVPPKAEERYYRTLAKSPHLVKSIIRKMDKDRKEA